MKTGLTKRQKVTELWFNEDDALAYIRVYNTRLKNQLLKFSREYPECCKLTDDDELGCMQFEIDRSRLSFRLTKPYSDERKKAQSVRARKMYVSNGGIGRRRKENGV